MLTIPVLSRTPNLLKELIRTLPNINFHEVQTPDNDRLFKQSEILVCDFDLLARNLNHIENAKWVQGTWAGIDKLMPAIQAPPKFQVTRFTGDAFGRLMGEYVVSNIVQYERDLFRTYSNKKESKWVRGGKITKYRVISDLTLGILGGGNIGTRIGKILHCFGGTIFTMGRRQSLPAKEEYSHVTKYFPASGLSQMLTECDYIINVLPKTPETNAILDNDILENCKEKQAVFINIGRSNVISESSLIKALDNNWLGFAILDVFDTEPLPPDNPLWKHEKILITPHTSGMTRPQDVAKQFKTNLELYQNNQPLQALIDFSQGY